MADAGKRKRPRQLDGWAAVERWFEHYPDEDPQIIEDALFAIQEDTWADTYRHVDDVTRPTGVVMHLPNGHVMVWRVITEYPDWFRIIYVGDPDDTTF